MRELVIRGPREHPGASMVQFEDGSTQTLVSRIVSSHEVPAVMVMPIRFTGYTVERAANRNCESAAYPSAGRERANAERATDQSALCWQEGVPALTRWRYFASQPATHAAQTEYDGAQGESVARGADYSHALRELVSHRGAAPFTIAHISSGSNSYNGGHFHTCTGGRPFDVIFSRF